MGIIRKMNTFCMFLLVLDVTYSHCLTREESALVLCVEEIAISYLTEGPALMISLPTTSSEVSHVHSAGSKLQVADKLLEHIHKRTISPILISRQGSDSTQNILTPTHQSYIILLWPDEADDLTSTLRKLLNNIVLLDNIFNHRGKFLIVVTDFGIQFPNNFAMNITEILRKDYGIINSLIMVPNTFQPTENGEEYIFDFYTWFPYESEQCGTLKEVVLLERYRYGNDRCVSTGTSLFPSKTPLNINGCPIRISTCEIHPNIIKTSAYEEEGDSVIYQYRGAEIEYLLLLSEAMNMTVKFLPTTDDKMLLSDCFFHVLTSIYTGEAEIAMGSLPLNFRAVSFGDPTVPYIYNSYKWYVPCARPIRKIDNVMNIFTASTWLALILVLALSSLSFWAIANSPSTSSIQESRAYKSLSQTFNYAWAVLVGVSVAQMPVTFRMRGFFFLFVCYCFAINTIFQAFFTSYLIEPRFDKQIGTFDDLNTSGITYLKHPSLSKLALYINYDQHEKLRIPQENCENYTECMLRFLEGTDVTVMVTDIWAEYFAFTTGRDKSSLCTIDENVFTMGLAMYVPKDFPLLQRFNALLRRCLEAGLGQKYWSELTWNESLHKYHQGDSDNEHDSMYFAFTTFHLRIAFCLLAFGGAMSCIAFIAELITKHFGQLFTVE
ncbi:hypothetical protein B7P43_G05038 [Cryptotermes secundus]|uniref:Ionotropic glutamate receptor C-terminal domain-containing protein n=1 Tax=Cryptotermes secundus TaxID=105785 RepID=A0A2J7PQL1_9NEOP|nr:hypothetical protein B7P43_G05038 [Cryptotermes secundus]